MDTIKKEDVIAFGIVIAGLIILHLILWLVVELNIIETLSCLWLADMVTIAFYVVVAILTNNWNPLKLLKKNQNTI